MRLVSLSAIVLALALAGCDSGAPETCSDTGTEVQKVDVTVGTGSATANTSSVVTLTYAGRFTNGTEFDSGRLENEPLSGYLPGFRLGIAGMKIGGRRTITIPPALGYGSLDREDNQGNVVIPACSTLIFDVTLLDVR